MTFERLTRDGRRARTATLWCRYLDDPDASRRAWPSPSAGGRAGRDAQPAAPAAARAASRAVRRPPLVRRVGSSIGARPAPANCRSTSCGGEVADLLDCGRRRDHGGVMTVHRAGSARLVRLVEWYQRAAEGRPVAVPLHAVVLGLRP